MKCPVCKLEHEPAYAVETLCVTTLRDHLNAALELLAIREKQIGEFLEEKDKTEDVISMLHDDIYDLCGAEPNDYYKVHLEKASAVLAGMIG